MSDERALVEKRAVNNADSLRFTYKQHFTVANFYRFLVRALDAVMFGAAALLVADNFWTLVPTKYLVIPPLVIAAITGYRRGTNLNDQADQFRQSARQYHTLFDRYRDFLTITLETDDVEDVRREFEELSEERRDLNRTTPDANGFWYHYIKWKGEDQLNEEVTTTSETREALSATDQRTSD